MQRHISKKRRTSSRFFLFLRKFITIVDISVLLSLVVFPDASKNLVYARIKVKVTLEQATKAQRGSRGINLLFL
jgi:hypothetical protein